MDDRNASTFPSGTSRADVVVVGAGLAGLAAAALIGRTGQQVLVLDGGLPGGRARTDSVGSHRLNRGAHAIYDGGHARRVLGDLGVTWTGHPPATDRGYVSIGDEMQPLPGSTLGALTSKLLSVREKASLGKYMATLKSAKPGPSMSTAAWLAEHGPSGRAGDLVRMLARIGSYTEPLERLSADAGAAQLRLALEGVTYIDDGWQVLVEGLLAACAGCGAEVADHRQALSLTTTPGGWHVDTPDGGVSARNVVIAAGGPGESARLLGTDPWGDLGGPVTAAAMDVGLGGAPADYLPVPVLFALDAPLYLSQHTPTAVHLLRYDARSADADKADLLRHAALAGLDVAAEEANGGSSRFLARMIVAHSVPSPQHGGLAGRPGVAVPSADGAFVTGDWVGARGLLADASLASAEEAAAAVVGRRVQTAAAGGAR